MLDKIFVSTMYRGLYVILLAIGNAHTDLLLIYKTNQTSKRMADLLLIYKTNQTSKRMVGP